MMARTSLPFTFCISKVPVSTVLSFSTAVWVTIRTSADMALKDGAALSILARTASAVSARTTQKQAARLKASSRRIISFSKGRETLGCSVRNEALQFLCRGITNRFHAYYVAEFTGTATNQVVGPRGLLIFWRIHQQVRRDKHLVKAIMG